MCETLALYLLFLLQMSFLTGQKSNMVNAADNIFALPEGEGGMWFVTTDRRPGCPAASCKTAQWRVVIGRNGERMIQFTIVGDGLGWVGIAISRDMFMGDDDAYFCSRSSPQSAKVRVTSAVLSGGAPPSGNQPIEEDRVLLSSIEGDTLICTFLRPLRVSKIINDQPVAWDLSQENSHLLFAEGTVSPAGSLHYHSFRRSTKKSFNFLSSAGYKSLLVFSAGIPTTASTTTTTGKSISRSSSTTTTTTGTLALIDLKQSSSGGITWTFPFGCEKESVPCRSLSFEPVVINGDVMVQTTVSGSAMGSYVGFLISDQLGSSDCYYCIRELVMGDVVVPARVVSSTCNKTQFSDGVKLPQEQITRIEETQGSLLCTFLRPVSVNKTANEGLTVYDISSTKYSLIYEEGRLNENGSIAHQDFTASSSASLQLIDLSIFRQQSAVRSTPSIVKAESKTTGATGVNTGETTTTAFTERKIDQARPGILQAQVSNSQALQQQRSKTQNIPLLLETTTRLPSSDFHQTNVTEENDNQGKIQESIKQRLNGKPSPSNQVLTTSSGSNRNSPFFSFQILILVLFALSARV